jgi:hypothetical protein
MNINQEIILNTGFGVGHTAVEKIPGCINNVILSIELYRFLSYNSAGIYSYLI